MTIIKIVGFDYQYCDVLHETYYQIYAEDPSSDKKYQIYVSDSDPISSVIISVKEVDSIPQSLEYTVCESISPEIDFPIGSEKIYSIETHLFEYYTTARTARYYDDSEDIFEIDFTKFQERQWNSMTN